MTRRTFAWLGLLALTLGTVALVGVPMWLLQPFSPQTPGAVAWSRTLRSVAPVVTAVSLLAVIALAAVLWRGRSGRAARTALVLAVLATSGAAWFARQNHFEWMFRPFLDARFVTAADARDVPAEEPVIGVAGDGAALAFPITRIGYHHLVNTTLGAVPIVATY